MFSKVAASSDFTYGSTVGELAPAVGHRAAATARPRPAPRVTEPQIDTVSDRVERFRTLQMATFGTYIARI